MSFSITNSARNANVDEEIKPQVEKVQDGARKITNVVKQLHRFIVSIPGIATLLGIASTITLFIYFMLFIFTKYSFGGVERARNIYSGFYLITSLIMVIIIITFANPIIDHNTSEVTNQMGTDKLINEIFDIINTTVNMAALPFMIFELLFIVLIVFIVTLMFVITSSLLRTYYAIQCPLDKKIQVVWWAKIIDFFMYCFLIIFFLCYVVLSSIVTVLKRLNKQHTWCSAGLLLVRKSFVITLAYYIVQLLFSGMEYLISNNILSIHNWKNPQVECNDNPAQNKTQSMPKYIENIFYLFLNVVLCILIWLIIIALIAGHIYVSAFLISLDKIVSLTDTIFTIIMYLLSGNITINGITEVSKTVLDNIKKIVPNKLLPAQFLDIDPQKLINSLRAQLAQVAPSGSLKELQEKALSKDGLSMDGLSMDGLQAKALSMNALSMNALPTIALPK